MCKKMTFHWRKERSHWLNRDGESGEAFFPLREIWDGTRFAELSWFWDPRKSWPLPIFCKLCNQIISVSIIQYSPSDDNIFSVTCRKCGTKQQCELKTACGDPRNMAFIGHWDGWQPGFGAPGKHSCGNNRLFVSYLCRRLLSQGTIPNNSAFSVKMDGRCAKFSLGKSTFLSYLPLVLLNPFKSNLILLSNAAKKLNITKRSAKRFNNFADSCNTWPIFFVNQFCYI